MTFENFFLQDEEDRKLALEALGLARPEDGEDAAGTGGGANEHRQRRHREGDRKEAAAAEAAAEAAISKSKGTVMQCC